MEERKERRQEEAREKRRKIDKEVRKKREGERRGRKKDGRKGREGGWEEEKKERRTPDVGSEEVVHLVAQGGLTEESGAADQVADGDVEVVVSRAPVTDLGERVLTQDLLEWNGDILVNTHKNVNTHTCTCTYSA